MVNQKLFHWNMSTKKMKIQKHSFSNRSIQKLATKELSLRRIQL